MQNAISKIKNELNNFYCNNEINSLISIIIEFITGMNNTRRLLTPDYKFDESQNNQLHSILNRLQKYEPIQYIIGSTFFYDLHFNVNKDVLIPRPETEELVDWIINDFKKSTSELKIIDIGTGSGCIAISLAKSLSNSLVTGIDISADAINVARENAKLNKLENIDFIVGNILNHETLDFKSKLDIIVSNPPYITHSEFNLMPDNVKKHEPHIALFVENQTPLLFYSAIALFGKKNLKKGGTIYFEINERFGNETENLLQALNYSGITLKKDINNKDRMIKAEL